MYVTIIKQDIARVIARATILAKVYETNFSVSVK